MSATIVGGSSGVAFDVDAVPKAARAILYDSAGNPINSATVNAETQLLTAASQYVYEFTANSSTANIGAGASFTGASQSNMGVAAIQVGIFVNQNCTVELQQSLNGSDWDFVSRYFVVASAPDNRTFVAKGSFVRIVVTNTSGSTATTVRIQTIGVPVSAPLTYRDGVAVDWVQQPTYRAVFTGAPLAGVCMSLKGSASKLVTVTRVGWSATDNAGTSVDVTIAKCTAMAPGTAASLTMVPLDSKFPAATALAQSWSVAPTPTVVGSIYGSRYFIGKLSTTTGGQVDLAFGDMPGVVPVRLRGVGEWLAVLFSAVGGSPAADIWMGWTEE